MAGGYAGIDWWTGDRFTSLIGYLAAVVIVAWAAPPLVVHVFGGSVVVLGWLVAALHPDWGNLAGVTATAVARLVIYEGVLLGSLLLRDALDLASAEAHHDPLTGLLNRRGLALTTVSTVASADRRGTPLAVVCADLDGLKAVNDRWGHAAGDERIVAAAHALRSAARATDHVARVGGDEFVVVLSGSDRAAATSYVARVRGLTTAPPMSMGVAVREPGGATLDELFLHADVAALEDKARRRTQHLDDPLAPA